MIFIRVLYEIINTINKLFYFINFLKESFNIIIEL